jgi:hypothetical protein
MGFLTGGSSSSSTSYTPPPPAPPPLPPAAIPPTLADANARPKKAAKAVGDKSGTVKTSPQGVDDGTTAKATLLGG